MLANLFNAKDLPLINEAFLRFNRPDCHFNLTRIRKGYPNESIPFKRVTDTLPAAIYESLHLAPDTILSITDTMFILRSDGTSRLECNATITGTLPLFFDTLPGNMFEAFQFIFENFLLIMTFFKNLKSSFQDHFFS